MEKPIKRWYESDNDSLDVMFEYNYSTMKFEEPAYWLTVYLTNDGKPGMFWIRDYQKHQQELKKLYPDYDFEGEIDAEKYAAYEAERKTNYPSWSEEGKKVPNKWRGERINGAGAIYGTLFIRQIGTLIYDGVGWAKVKPESLSKLAGYDAEGNEVYRSCKP